MLRLRLLRILERERERESACFCVTDALQMGKLEEQRLPQQQIHGPQPTGRPAGIFERGLRGIAKCFNFRCVLFLILGLAVFVSAIFWILPHQARRLGFDANDTVKLSATVQAYFKLPKPVSLLIPQIERLKFDISGEIGVPNTKVAILSMHQAMDANYTDVVFGVLSDPISASINPVSLSMLRSSLIDLFLQQYNLTITTSIFGQPSSFGISKFPGGLTVNLEPYASFWNIQQILFNFTLINSLSDIHINYSELKEQLKLGLLLRSYENVYMQATNKDGSTRNPPVTVQASVTSELGNLLPERLKQLALIITGSPPARNLGLDNSVFGKVKEVSLSSYLKHTLQSSPPTPSPTPSPSPNSSPRVNCDASSPSDNSNQPAPNPKNGAHNSFPPYSDPPAPSSIAALPPRRCPYLGLRIPPRSSPVSHSEPPASSAASPPAASPYSPHQATGSGRSSTPPSLSPSSFALSASSAGSSYKGIWELVFAGIAIFLLCSSR